MADATQGERVVGDLQNPMAEPEIMHDSNEDYLNLVEADILTQGHMDFELFGDCTPVEVYPLLSAEVPNQVVSSKNQAKSSKEKDVIQLTKHGVRVCYGQPLPLMRKNLSKKAVFRPHQVHPHSSTKDKVKTQKNDGKNH